MFFRKTGILTAVAAAMLLFGGCSADGRMDKEEARNWYNEINGYGTQTVDGAGSVERNSYGMRTDEEKEGTLGEELRHGWDEVKEDVKNMTDEDKK